MNTKKVVFEGSKVLIVEPTDYIVLYVNYYGMHVGVHSKAVNTDNRFLQVTYELSHYANYDNTLL